jgi:hypothetical protein
MNVIPRRHEIGWKPGDEEHLRRVATELSERGTQHLSAPEQRDDSFAAKRTELAFELAAAASSMYSISARFAVTLAAGS